MSKTKVITGEVLFSFVHVFEAHAHNEGDTPKYSVSVIIPKKDKATIAKIEAAIEAAAQEGVAKFGGKVPKNYKQPLRDGDEEKDVEEYPEYANSMFLNASSNRKPQLVDADLDPILDKDEFYSGCYGRASINFYAFAVSGNKGVAAGLNNIQKLDDGTRLGGSASSAEDDFNDELM